MLFRSCIDLGAEWGKEYKVNKILNRERKQPFTIKLDGEVIYSGEYTKKYVRNDVYNFKTI